MSSPPKSLDELARSLLANGPVKTLSAAPKRIRIQLGGQYVADTTDATYVWEHAYYPTYYVPVSSFAEGVLAYSSTDYHGEGYALATLSAGGKSTDRVVVFTSDGAKGKGKGGVLAGLARVEFAAADAWFEEDSRVDVHPKDPFKRVDVVFSARPVCVLVSGVEVARTPGGSFHLYETGLPARFYLPPTSVHATYLRESETRSVCPYKGEANYYHVVLPGEGEGEGEGKGERVWKDVVWYYKNPKMECAAIAGLLCFYNEKVDIELDGKML
jgi:uncharacterized protein (DUF427 family)